MKFANVLLLTAIATFLCSAGTCNATYKQRDKQKQLIAEPVIELQQDKERWNYYTDQLGTPYLTLQHRQEYCEAKTEPAGETFRHRHQLKKGANETGGSNKKQKGAGGQNKKRAGGVQKGSGRK